MNQLSLRQVDKQLERKLRAMARREGVSLDQAAVLLMRRGAGLAEAAPRAERVGGALDRFVGRWSAADERRFLRSIAACEALDEALWK